MRSHRKSVDRLRREMASDQWKRFTRGAGAQSPHLFSLENPSRDRTAVIAFHSASEGDVKTLMDIDWTKPKKRKLALLYIAKQLFERLGPDDHMASL